jgi:hypothetical protein
MAQWVLFYDDGAVVTDRDCVPDIVPGYGCICGAQEDTRKHPGLADISWVTFAGEYLYFSIPDQFWRPAQSWADIEDLVLHRKPVTGICKGRTVPDDVFWPIWDRCKAWADARGLPEKTGFAPGERNPAGPRP